jgi:hypothetical protein
MFEPTNGSSLKRRLMLSASMEYKLPESAFTAAPRGAKMLLMNPEAPNSLQRYALALGAPMLLAIFGIAREPAQR